MSHDRQFPEHTVVTAPAAARPLLVGSQKMFGFIPSPMARLAVQPAVASAFLHLNGVWERTSLTETEREVVVMAVARANGCAYCVAMHSAALARNGAPAPLIEALRSGARLAAPRLEALAAFTRAVLRDRGDVGDVAWRRFREVGFDHAAALEVVLGVATYTLSTFSNRLTQAPLDPAFEAFRWHADASPAAHESVAGSDDMHRVHDEALADG